MLTLTLDKRREGDLQNLLNLEKKLKTMKEQIEGLVLGHEVAHEQAVFWEKKANGFALELKIAEKRLEVLDSVEQELETYKIKVGDLAK